MNDLAQDTSTRSTEPDRPGRRDTLLFDLDGTLVDTAPDLTNALNLLLRENGRAPLPLRQVVSMVGDGARKLVERGFDVTGGIAEKRLDPLLQRFLEIYTRDVAVESRPYEDVPDTLARLRAAGWRMAVCTNKPQRASEALLSALDLERYMDAIVGGDSVSAKKPDPRHVLETLARLRATNNQAVMVGDSMNDVTAAHEAGVATVCVSYGYCRTAPEALGAQCLIHRFADLPAALRSLAEP